MFIVVVSHCNLCEGLTHRQKYDSYHVSSDISDTNTEILTAVMSQCNLGYSTFIFTGWNSSFFLVLASNNIVDA